MEPEETQLARDEADASGAAALSRRDVVRHGVKLAFVAPLIATFFAQNAYGSNHSCLPAGSPCTANAECCSNDCDTSFTNQCQ